MHVIPDGKKVVFINDLDMDDLPYIPDTVKVLCIINCKVRRWDSAKLKSSARGLELVNMSLSRVDDWSTVSFPDSVKAVTMYEPRGLCSSAFPRELPAALEELCVVSAGLEYIPSQVADAPRLMSLELFGNPVSELPPQLLDKDTLELLGLGGTRLEFLPRLPPRLKALYLHQCPRLTSLPALPDTLEELSVMDNPVFASFKAPPGVPRFNQEEDIVPLGFASLSHPMMGPY